MILHFIRISLIILLILLCMFLPFIPGNYDGTAITLSFMSQLFGFVGLLLVPIGSLWLIYELKKKRKDRAVIKSKSYHFAVVTLIASIIVIIVVSLGAFLNDQLALGFITLAFCGCLVLKFIPQLRQMKKANDGRFNPTPYYLIFIPLITALVRLMFIIPANEYSRNYTIRQSERLIQSIETYHQKNGHYPVSLLSIWTDYEPSVIGIKQFHYEQNGKAFNLYFEQFSYKLDIREIVMYNKLDEHTMTAHDADLLELSQHDLDLQRGYVSVHHLSTPHWKYFWFD